MANINVGGSVIKLSKNRPTGTCLMLTKNGETWWGKLSPNKPSYRTLKFSKSGTTLYLVNAEFKVKVRMYQVDDKGKKGGDAKLWYYNIYNKAGRCVISLPTNITLNGTPSRYEGWFTLDEPPSIGRIELGWHRDCSSNGTVQAWFYMQAEGGKEQLIMDAGDKFGKAPFKSAHGTKSTVWPGRNNGSPTCDVYDFNPNI